MTEQREHRDSYPMVPRRVVCAALRRSGGLIICGARHFDPIMRQVIGFIGGRQEWLGVEQGFIDQYGAFMPREEARVVAEAAGQIVRRVGGDSKILFSENLY